MDRLLITICARAGSKGIPNKNRREMNGMPLVAYTINIARRFAVLTNGVVALSTDSEPIKETAAAMGLDTSYVRPPELSADNTGKIDTIRHLLLSEEKRAGTAYDYIVDLDVTSPLRTISDLTAAYTAIRNDKEALNLFSVSRPHRNPYFNVVEKHPDGYYRLVKSPEKPVVSRQTAPVVYDLNASFYFYRRKFFDMGFRNAYTDRSMVWLIDHFCFDLDEPIDFLFMEYLMKNKLLDFDFSESSSNYQ
ncbi:MAG: acylneuraminate cytidylyltransferase family protein [Bacteroidales bacterium]|jgi:CMP-N-acetylneuraminic acid synthetase|nr:acylneuraminate cytidylyltransferase family protein [Bacteroidales bacterium]